MRLPRRPLIPAFAAVVLLLAVPTIASADISRTRGCDGTGGVVLHEEATASVVVTQGDSVIAGEDVVEAASPRASLLVTVTASGTGIPSTFTARLGARTATGAAPGTATVTAPKAAGEYTMVVLVTAGSACDLSLELDVPITVGVAGAAGSGSVGGSGIHAPGSLATGDDRTRPTVVLRPLTAKRGHRLRFPYQVIGESDATVDTIDIRRSRGGAPVVSKDLTSAAMGVRRAPLTPPAGIAAGAWWWCVTSIDQSGNESKSTCARLTLR